MSKKGEMSDCIDDKLKEFKPIGDTPQKRAENTRKAFKEAAEDCLKKLYDV